MKLIVGLGNPGKQYDNSRHNIGFMILDYFLGDEIWKEKFSAFYTEKNYSGEKVLFIKPLTYMNESGLAVERFVNFYKISPQDILVIHDDLDLPFGKYRLKYDTSSGGHNGIKSIIAKLNTKLFCHLKVGISNDKKYDTKDYVLGKFFSEEQQVLKESYPLYKEVIEYFIKNGIEKTMNTYNKK